MEDTALAILTFGTTMVYVYSTGTAIHFDDGFIIRGEPEDTDDYRATAMKYGYGTDTLSLCIDHEITHVALGSWLGRPSPTLEALRTDPDQDMPLRRLEEMAVLAIQQYARAANIDMKTIQS